MKPTSVQISREASELLDQAVKESGLRKGYLADTAIKYFLDPNKNPGVRDALQHSPHVRELAEQDFVDRVFANGTRPHE